MKPIEMPRPMITYCLFTGRYIIIDAQENVRYPGLALHGYWKG